MAISTVKLNGETIMTVNDTTTDASEVLSGQYFYAADGTKTQGSIETKTSSDLTVSGATVTTPAGYYASSASKSVASGTAGTPTATKGTVSNHSVSITPSVTNTTGYITGGTKNGTAVTVSASELVSGSQTITMNGTVDVTNLEEVEVSVVPFVVTLTQNSTTGNWEPDKTYAQILAAYNDGMDIDLDPQNYEVATTYSWYSDYSLFYYQVVWFDYDSIIDDGYYYVDEYALQSSGLTLTNRAAYTGIPTLVAKTFTANGTYNPRITDSADGYSEVTVAIPSGTVTAPSTISGSSATVSTGTNTLTLSKTISVTPNVTSAGYISSGTAGNANVSLTASVNTRSSSDLTASGATVTAPSGYYASAASASVASGTAGTPSASKSAVSNHSITITPTVTNSTGYITGGTKTGTAVTVSASELASGTLSIASNASGINVVGYSAVDVDVPGVDVPVFTLTIDPSGTVVSSTCNKTYAQCAQLLENTGTYAAVVQINSTYSSEDMFYGLCEGYTDYDSTPYALYGPVFRDDGLYDIKYRSNGNIELVSSEFYGEEGTPTATKGAVSNHSITVTPSVVNTRGFIEGNTTITGTPVTVSASELVSGTLSISSSGSAIDVTNYSAVNVPAGSAFTPAMTITANPSISINSSTGVITATAAGSSSITPTVNAGYISSGTAGTVSVSGSSNYQLTVQGAKTITPTESEQTAVASYRFTTGAVKVGAIPSTYVGSGVAQRSSVDLTASGSIVTTPAGYYAAAATKNITAGSATTPATTISVTPTISLNSATGAISVAVSNTESITPIVSAGYVSSGVAGTVTVSGSSSYGLTTAAASTYTPSASTQTIPAGIFLTGAQTIEPIPISVDSHRLILPEGLITV